MKLSFFSNHLFLLVGLGMKMADAQSCDRSWTCYPTDRAPTLDANHTDWADVEGYTSDLINSNTGALYDVGAITAKCVYDSEHIYFALEIPGEYRFNSTDDHLCAAIGFMFQMGPDATYSNMGGCPEAMGEESCVDGVPDVCESYKVDIGAHWELSGTQPNTLYDVSSTVAQGRQAEGGTGNDPIANKDDEYAFSPYCRFDDDDANADNEWAGAWAHTNPSEEGAEGTYHFEMSRKLKTASTVTDIQLEPGQIIKTGIAYWDPFYDEEIGWTAINHYVTGCASQWIDLELYSESTTSTTDNGADGDNDSGGVTMKLSALAAAATLFLLN